MRGQIAALLHIAKMLKFSKINFVTTAVNPEGFPQFPHHPEIAVVGRSNVGKSTLLNHLFHSKDLVKTSSTPGKTQTINFFLVDDRLVFADLPGYGYAKVSFKEKEKWSEMIEGYLNERLSPHTLDLGYGLILFLLDIRRIPSDEDLQMFEWISAKKIPTILVLTKVDKLNQGERMRQTKEILGRIQGLSYVHYSALKNEGRPQLIAQIQKQLKL